MDDHLNSERRPFVFLQTLGRCILLLGLAIGYAAHALDTAPAPRTVVEWVFDQESKLKDWVPNGDIIGSAIRDGAWTCHTTGDDPILELVAPLEFIASPRQMIEVRLKADHSGSAEFFWSNTNQGRYSGFSENKHTPFAVVGDGQWHVYRVFPFWQTEGKIIRLRFDLFGATQFSVQYIRISELPSNTATPSQNASFDFSRGLEQWTAVGDLVVSNSAAGLWTSAGGSTHDFLLSAPLRVDADDKTFVSIRMSATRGKFARLIFATDQAPGMHRRPFAIQNDGREHCYVLDMLGSPEWKGHILALGLSLSDEAGGTSVLRSLSTADQPQGSPELSIVNFGLEETAPRAGVASRLTALISNKGAGIVAQIRAELTLPDGVHLTSSPTPEALAARLGFSEEVALSWTVESPQPVSGKARLVLSGDQVESVSREVEISFPARPNLPKAAYVPEPKPVRGKYDVGVYYFPGWQTRSQWQPIERFPERKPVLGWYREGDPEVADWQIKWAVEHGITYFAYDWYWSQGSRSLEHGLHKGYLQSRYKNLLKFCLLWANHNAPKTHSLDDSVAVARYWITNYFQLPEYYRIDGKPVVIIFSPYNYKSDLGNAGVNEAFEAMRAECRRAGLPGLYLVACVGNARQVDGENYDAVSAYNWPGLGLSGDDKRAPYAGLVPAYQEHWSQLLKEDTKPILLPLSGGWDSRPWHGESAMVRDGRTPDLFREHLLSARRFLETSASNSRILPSVLVEAWNEWGEGSYIEPHREFGFGYLDAIREVFASGAENPHQDLAPVDVGLGPYDLPASSPNKTEWEFKTDSDDWKNTMDLGQVQVESGVLKALGTGRDPAFFGPPMRARAGEFPGVHIKMRLTHVSNVNATDSAQLFWRTQRWPESEANSVQFPVAIDGEWHDYDLKVTDNPRWTGTVTRLRLDPATQSGVRVEVQQIGLTRPSAVAPAPKPRASTALKIIGDWQLEIVASNATATTTATLAIEPPVYRDVQAEKFETLPLYNSNSWSGWNRGVPLRGVFAQECSTPGLLDPATLVIRAGPTADSAVYEPGKDYGADVSWGTIGCLPQGQIGEKQAAYATYRHCTLRIDSVILTASGTVQLRRGEPSSAAPLAPALAADEILLANIWFPGPASKLLPENLFPVLETAYPEPPKRSPTAAEKLTPNAITKLRQGLPIKIMAWGDSVTEGSYLKQGRWQDQFAARLQSRFPQAKIELITEAWGGRNTSSYLEEPPGSKHNYNETVLAQKPDLIISEFVNDAGFNPEQVEERYSKLLSDFQSIHAEWIILTPHYVRPDWMGLEKMRDCDEDPRPYVKGLRQFAAKHNVALADASLRFGHLWREGIPYNALMVNSINHPNEQGMKLFADALMELFP